ncbi:MAG: acyl-CoA dehydrogenase family protein, partial [Anaerolineae bacterium]
MDFTLSEEHRMIRDMARDFAQNEIAPIAAHYDETGEFPYETIMKMGEQGLMGIEVPEKYGGAEMDTLAYVLALEEISKADASHGTIMSVNNSLFCYGLLRFATEEQKQTFLTPVASGEAVAAYALTEPQSGSDAGNMRVTSTLSSDGSHYVVNGTKSWITSGSVARYLLLFVQTDPEATPRHRGVTALLIDTQAPGFSTGKVEPKLGIRASATCEIHFEDYRCPVAHRLGQDGEGFKIAMSVLDAGRIGIAA